MMFLDPARKTYFFIAHTKKGIMGKRGYSTTTNQEALKKSNLFDTVNNKLLWKFIVAQKWHYILFLTIVLISFPLQYASIPTSVAKIIEGLTKHGIPKNEKFFNIWKNITSKMLPGLSWRYWSCGLSLRFCTWVRRPLPWTFFHGTCTIFDKKWLRAW